MTAMKVTLKILHSRGCRKFEFCTGFSVSCYWSVPKTFTGEYGNLSVIIFKRIRTGI